MENRVYATSDPAAIVAALRAGVRPTEAEAALLKRRPLIDELRRQVAPADVPVFLAIVDAEEGYVAALHLSVLRHQAATPVVRKHLRRRWETADAFLRAGLVWRILDDPELPAEWHQRLFDFITAEPRVFNDVSVEFIGGRDKLFAYCLQRLGDPTNPATKKWVYLCNAAEAEDRGMARTLVTLGLYLDDPFARDIASKLLARLDAATR